MHDLLHGKFVDRVEHNFKGPPDVAVSLFSEKETDRTRSCLQFSFHKLIVRFYMFVIFTKEGDRRDGGVKLNLGGYKNRLCLQYSNYN